MIGPLIALWLLTNGGKGGGAGLTWPGTKHPPPNKLPARKRRAAAAPHAAPAHADQTPDSALSHPHAPDAAPHVPEPVAPPTQTMQPADTSVHASPGVSMAISVLTAQKLLNKTGAKLKPDGLFGPKTVSAWRTFASRKQLDPTIVRLGPKTVDVNPNTYGRLQNATGIQGVGQYEPPLYIP